MLINIASCATDTSVLNVSFLVINPASRCVICQCGLQYAG